MTHWIYKLDPEKGSGQGGAMTFEEVKEET